MFWLPVENSKFRSSHELLEIILWRDVKQIPQWQKIRSYFHYCLLTILKSNRRIHDRTVIFSIRSGSINERGVRKRCIITTTVCESAACNLCDVHSSDVTWHSEQSSCCRSSTSDVSSVCGRLCAAGSKRVGHTVVLLITTRVPLHGSCWIILHFVYWYPDGGHCATLTECPCWGCVHSCSTRGGRHTHIHKVQKYQHLYVISTRAEWSISV